MTSYVSKKTSSTALLTIKGGLTGVWKNIKKLTEHNGHKIGCYSNVQQV